MWGPPGRTYLDEGEDQAHGEVGQPVHASPHHEGRRPGGLQEDLGDEQRGDGTWGRGRVGEEEQLPPLEAAKPPKGPGAPAVSGGPRHQAQGALCLRDSRAGGEAEREGKNGALQVTPCDVPTMGL